MSENLDTLGSTYDRVSVNSKCRFVLESVYYKQFVIKRRSRDEYRLSPIFYCKIGLMYYVKLLFWLKILKTANCGNLTHSSSLLTSSIHVMTHAAVAGISPRLLKDGILAGSEEGFDLQVYIDPLEEKFCVPTQLVKTAADQSREDKVVRQQDQYFSGFRITEANLLNFLRVFAIRFGRGHPSVLFATKTSGPINGVQLNSIKPHASTIGNAHRATLGAQSKSDTTASVIYTYNEINFHAKSWKERRRGVFFHS
jgi:hypothetical protein